MKISKCLGVLTGLAVLAALWTPAGVMTAQDQPQPKVADDSKDAFTSSTTFRHEGLIFVDARVNGKGPYNFLFDSGASMSIVGTRLAKELSLKTVKSPAQAQGVGQQDMSLALLDTLRVADFEREELPVGVMDLDHISGELGKHMHGIIGQNMIKYMRRTVFDFPSSTLSITRYRKGQGPLFDTEETMLKLLLKGGLEMPKLPELPGLPDLPDFPDLPKIPGWPGKDKPDPAPPDDDDQFSASSFEATGLMGAAPEKVAFAYKHLKIMGGLMEVAMWFVEVKINGRTQTLFFDTGASALCVLTQSAAKDLRVPTSFQYPVKGVGESSAGEGILESLEVGGLKILEPTCSVMDLDKLLGQLEMLGGKCQGIVGLPLATRFKRMIVDGEARHVTLEPYESGEPNPFDPAPSEEMMKNAVIATWNNKASRLGFHGDAVALDDWAKLKLEKGGLRVASVDAASAAAKAGLRAGDIVVAVVGAEKDDNDKPVDMPVRGISGLIVWACTRTPGTSATFRVLRDGEAQEITFKLDAYPFSGKFPDKYRQK